MRGGMHIAQALGVHACIDLRGGKRCVAQQGLDRTEVCASCQKVRRKGVAKCMWRRSIRQAEHRAELLNQPLNQAWIERPALRPPEQSIVATQIVGTKTGIGVNGRPYYRNQGHDPHLAALSGNSQSLRRRNISAGQAEGFRNPQARTIEQ